MPQVTWKGNISFGLVSVPVQLYAATESHSGPALHQVHEPDGGRIRMKRFCELEDREVPYSEITRGWTEPGHGRTVVLTDEDFSHLPVPSRRVIDVLGFVPAERIDPLRFSTPYYVGLADKGPGKSYALLREALRESGQVAVTKVTLRSRESLAVLRVQDDLMVLQTVLWPDEIRSAQDVAAPEERLRPQELKMARSLMDTLSEDFDPDALRDDYAQALEQTIAAKLEGVAPVEEQEAPEGGGAQVIDLMDALRNSVRAAKASREAGGSEEENAEPAESARKAPAKRSAAKKAPTKDAAAKKPAPRKQTSAAKSTGTAKKTAAKKSAAKSTRRKAS